MNQADYYQTLGVAPETGAKELKEAYRKLAFKYHPDRNEEDPAAAEKMKEINEAYAVLSHTDKRRDYDAMRYRFGDSAAGQFRQDYTQQDIFSGSDVQQIFEEMSRAFGLRGFDEIFKDFDGPGYRSFNVKKPGFSYSGFVLFGGTGGGDFFRKALSSGNRLGALPRMFSQLLSGGAPTDKGGDRHETITLSTSLAREGGPYAYFHKNLSKKLIVRIPPGTRDGQRIRLSGMGAAGQGGAATGDLYLAVKIQTTLKEKLMGLLGG